MFSYKHVRLCLGLLLLLGCWYTAGAVSAQGLVGAPVDPMCGRLGGAGGIGKDAYNIALLVVGIASGVSLLLVGVFAWHRAKKVSGKRLVAELMLVGLIPLVIYIGGITSVNGLAGLSSCPIANPIAMQSTMLVAGCHHV